MRMVSTHLSYDFSKYLQDDDVLIRWLVNPDSGGSWTSGVLVAMGPNNWGTRSEEWVFHLQFAMDDEGALDDVKVLERMRATLGIPDFSYSRSTSSVAGRWRAFLRASSTLDMVFWSGTPRIVIRPPVAWD